MSAPPKMWLVSNDASGSNTPAAIGTLLDRCRAGSLEVVGHVRFPEEALPTPAALDGEGVGLVVIYAGDGTVNACVTQLYGWGGAVLVLPGGTKNLLAKRLHGDTPADTIVDRVAAGAARRVRPLIARCSQGDALAGLLAGPGTAWYDVREAMRDADLPRIAGSANAAVAQSTAGPMIVCADPALGSRDGYPLIEITPGEWGLQVDGYRSETAGEYLRQALALVKRNFREGPHERLGMVERVRLANSAHEGVGLMLDGEQCEGAPGEDIAVATCEVDLLATANGC